VAELVEISSLPGISKTLLMPLLARAKATREHSSIFTDTKALEIVERLRLDLAEFDQTLHPSHEIFAIARSRALDACVRRFLSEHPRATVVNLGAGLDTAYQRLDNGFLNWIDVDMTPVVEVRRTLIPETDRNHYVAASVLEGERVKKIKPRSTEVFFLACGVLVYFRVAELRNLFSVISLSFPASEMAFDMQSKMFNFFGNMRLKRAGMESARFRWGASSGRHAKRLHKNLEVLEENGIFDGLDQSDFSDRALRRQATIIDRFRLWRIVRVRFSDRQPVGDI